MMARRVLLLFFLAQACAVAAVAQQKGETPPASVVLDAVRLENVEPRREAIGELRAVRHSLIAAEEAGLVIEMAVDPGDSVKQGDTLARLDSTLLEIDEQRAQATVRLRKGVVEERRVGVERAERDRERIEGLVERSSATQHELDDAISDLHEAQAQLEQAVAELDAEQANVKLLQQRRARMVIRSPFKGRVVTRMTELGEWVQKGDAVAEVLSLDELDAWIDVSQKYIGALQDGQLIQIRVTATGEIIEAPVSSIIAAADPLSRMFPVRIRLDNKRGLLKPGMSVVGLVPIGKSQAMLTVNKDAILRDDAGAYIYYNAGGVAASARVTPLFAVANRMVVRSPDLPPDAGAIIEGNERLYPGQPIRIVHNASAARAAEPLAPERQGG